jgi:uncharacterized protein (DUF1330 family)
MEKYINSTKAQSIAFAKMPIDQPLQMVNLLKFKAKVENSELTGEEQYQNYINAIQVYLKEAQAKILFYGKTELTLIGPEGENEWDKVVIVQYPSKQHFLKMATTPNYPHHLRSMALEDSRLIFCSMVS